MRPYPKAATRLLSVFAFDPSLGRAIGNRMTLAVPYEELRAGPIGRKIAVVDYDASNDAWYHPVDLDERHVLLRNGLDPSDADPRFHQQMVYAVASETIRRFEFALGREVKWRHRRNRERSRLRIFPHAFQQANAFFDAGLNALLFGYFAAEMQEAGSALPGQTVFTCLSHDIIAHETTHAIIHSIRQNFSEQTSLDPAAFHEAFADIVALFQHFSVKDALTETVRRTGGLLHERALRPRLGRDADRPERALIGVELTEANPLVGLARQFGDAIGTRKALREALGKPADPTLIDSVTEPHARGSILVAAVFDAFFSVYIETTRPLMRIAAAGGAVGANGDLHPDLVEMLAKRAAKIAERFLTICIRAIDYCPPVDIQFGEFLRAIVTADKTLVSDDPHGYREALISAFRCRGIVPEDVTSYSEEALIWRGPADSGQNLPPLEGLHFDALMETTDTAARQNADRAQLNAILLNAYAIKHADVLKFAPGPDGKVTVQAHSLHPVNRIGPDGKLLVEFVVEFLQQREERLDPNDLQSPKFTFRGGSTMIFNHRGEVRFVVDKRIGNEARLMRQRNYLLSLGELSAASAFTGRTSAPLALNFAAIHRGC